MRYRIFIEKTYRYNLSRNLVSLWIPPFLVSGHGGQPTSGDKKSTINQGCREIFLKFNWIAYGSLIELLDEGKTPQVDIFKLGCRPYIYKSSIQNCMSSALIQDINFFDKNYCFCNDHSSHSESIYTQNKLSIYKFTLSISNTWKSCWNLNLTWHTYALLISPFQHQSPQSPGLRSALPPAASSLYTPKYLQRKLSEDERCLK